MPDDPLKKRQARAKLRAKSELVDNGYIVIPSHNDPVCLVAYRPVDGRVRLIRICLDAASPSDRKLMKPYAAPPNVSSECWVSRLRAHRFGVILP